MNHNYVIIMAGGIGSRIWPFSRNNFPKQFHDLLGTGNSLLQHTIDRFKDFCPLENIYIVTNEAFKDIVYEQIPEIQENQILLEPEGRNTAPCIAYASYKIHKKDPNALIVVSPSDHLILKDQLFKERLNIAIDHVSKHDDILTLGITPNRPNTGYGYINFEHAPSQVLRVKQFTEKPDLETAKKFVEAGTYVWNAGIFIWKSKVIVDAFKKYLPELDTIFQQGNDLYFTDKEQDFINSIYSQCPSISIDYGIMEKAENVFVVLSDIGWSDLGTWGSLYEVQEKDNHGNVVEGNVKLYDCADNLIKMPKDKLVVMQGLSGYIVAEYQNVLMICSKENEQMVKDFVKDVSSNQFI